MTENRKIGVGLYGRNGHQVGAYMRDCPFGELVAVVDVAFDTGKHPAASCYSTLEELLADPRVEVVSLCSPRRADQAADAIRALEAGKHVYAEKPAALSEEELERVLAVAERTGRQFHEMADTMIRQPYYAVAEAVRSGVIGEVVQVWAQKSYRGRLPDRPREEAIDGGLLRQVGIHAVRMIEHGTGLKIATVEAVETSLGAPKGSGELRTAAALLFTMENGAVGSAIMNYWNPDGFGRHGNDQLRVFGTRGMVEMVDDAQRTRLIVNGEDRGALSTETPVEPYFHQFLRHLLGQGDMTFTLEEELHPLRVVLRAKAGVRRAEA